jgi:hypothetical protein
MSPPGAGLVPSRSPGIVEEQVTYSGRVDAGDVLGCGGQEVVKVRVDHRRLVEQQRLDLAGDSPLRGQVKRRAVLFESLS